MTSAWRRAWPRIRHWLYWTHRWLGIGGCLLFVMWFVSGVVMMYVGQSHLTDEERLAGLGAVRFEQAMVTPAARRQRDAGRAADAREDVYWYGHHRERIVPIWRFEFDDAARSLDFPWLIQYQALQ